MVIDHGMNIAEVRSLADQVTAAAKRVRDHARVLDRLVTRAHWGGPVGTKFKSQWWPQHRANLLRIAGDLEHFAAQARSDANQQEGVSDGRSAGAGPTAAAAATGQPIDFQKAWEKGLFYTSHASDTLAFIKDFKAVSKLSGFADLFERAGAVKVPGLTALGIGTNLFGLGQAAIAGNGDGMIRKGIDVGFDGVGLALPTVALAKSTWDVGYEVGKGVDWFFGEKLGGHESFINSVVQQQYGGQITPSSDIGQRYDGWSGFGTWVSDNAVNTGSAVSSLWRKVF